MAGAEPSDPTKKDVVWFALNDDRRYSPLAASGLSSRATVAPSRSRKRAASRLRLPDNGTECNGRANPPEGHAGDPDYARRMRRVDARLGMRPRHCSDRCLMMHC